MLEVGKTYSFIKSGCFGTVETAYETPTRHYWVQDLQTFGRKYISAETAEGAEEVSFEEGLKGAAALPPPPQPAKI